MAANSKIYIGFINLLLAHISLMLEFYMIINIYEIFKNLNPSGAIMQPSLCSIGYFYHPKPPLANSISPFDP